MNLCYKLGEFNDIVVYIDYADCNTVYVKNKNNKFTDKIKLFTRTDNCQFKVVYDFNRIHMIFNKRKDMMGKTLDLDFTLRVLADIVSKLNDTLIYFTLVKDYSYLNQFSDKINDYFSIITKSDSISTRASKQIHYLVQNKRDGEFNHPLEYAIFYDDQLYDVSNNHEYFRDILKGNDLRKLVMYYKFINADREIDNAFKAVKNINIPKMVANLGKKI